MIKNVIKRDGRRRKFNIAKVYNSIENSLKASGEVYTDEVLEGLVDKTVEEVSKDDAKSIKAEEIHTFIEKLLMNNGFTNAAKHFILYRNERNRVRETKSELFKIVKEIGATDLKNSNLLRDNGNVNGATVSTSMAKAGNETWKMYNLMTNIKPENAKAHMEGDIHIHDLDYYALTTNCLFIPLAKLLEKGFDTGNGFIRRPNSIGTAGALAAIIIQNNQNTMFGGQAFAHIDDDLAPFVDCSFRKNLKTEVEAYNTYSSEDVIVTDYSTISMDDPFGAIPSIPDNVIENAIKKTDKETFQAMEALIHNLNSLFSRSGNQMPFSSINFGLNTTMCGRMVIKNILKATRAGLGDGATAIFPISIFKMKKGVNLNPGDPNYDLWKESVAVLAERFYPNFVNVDSSFNSPYVKYDYYATTKEDFTLKKIATYDKVTINKNELFENEEIYKDKYEILHDGKWYTFDHVGDFEDQKNVTVFKLLRPETAIASMGCRTRVIGNINGSEQTDGRGNLWFTTMNLPAMAMRACKTEDPIKSFWNELEQRLNQCVDVMKDRYELIAKRRYENFPFLMQQGVYLTSDDKPHAQSDEIREVLKQGSNAIGYIGIYETCKILLDKTYGVDKEAFEFGYKIVKHIREFCNKMEKETHLNWSCFATPAENVCGRFAELDKKKFKDDKDLKKILVTDENTNEKVPVVDFITGKGYYTNSHMLPFDLKTTLANKLACEAPFHALTNAGHIFYYKVDGVPSRNIEAVEKIIRAMYDADLGYYTVTMDQDRCRECGFTGIIDNECPKCGTKDNGENILRIRRITGYLVGRPGQSIEKSWGSGKRAELRNRKNI